MKFHLDINLDDPVEAEAFKDNYEEMFPDDVARALGIANGGAPAVYLAFDLQAYAGWKVKAIESRLAGSIGVALHCEKICDLIYKRIEAVCECW
jgi:hypothetical protein